jgi:hypothetical protein
MIPTGIITEEESRQRPVPEDQKELSLDITFDDTPEELKN